MAQEWPGQRVSGPADGPPPMRQIMPPRPHLPTAARPDQARGEAAGAAESEYRVRTQPARDAAREARDERGDQRAAEQQRFTQRQQILTSWRQNPQVRQFQEARTAFEGLRNLQRDPNGVNAVATIFAFMKTLDPGSTVREGEYATAQNTGGIPTSIANAYNSALSGNGLTDEQRRQMVEAAYAGLQPRARAYNEATYRAREELHGAGVSVRENTGQLPLSGVVGASGGELDNRTRDLYGIQRPVSDEAIARGEGATANAVDASQQQNRYGIPEGNLPPGYDVQFGMDGSGGERDDLQFTDSDLASMEAWLRAHGEEGTTDEAVQAFNAFVASLPSNPNWSGPHAIANPEGILSNWRERGIMFQGQNRVRPPDISASRGAGEAGHDAAFRAVEAMDATARGAVDTVTFGHGDEIGAAGDTVFSGGTYADNLRNQRAVDHYDEENHPYLRFAGQMGGMLVLPTGAGQAGRIAATAALRSGLSRAEAITAARTAIAQRMALEGTGYGAAHGFGSGEGDLLNRAAHAAVEAAMGGVSGRVLPEIGAFDRAAGVASREARTPAVRPPLVDETTGRLNQPLESASPAERVGAANAFGIDLPLGAATDRGGAIIEQGLDKLPGSAGVMNDARRGVGVQVNAAVEELGGRFGNSRSMNEGGDALQNSGRAWIRRAKGDPAVEGDRGVVGRAYNAVPIPGETASQVGNAVNYLRQINSRYSSNERIAAQQLDPELQGYQEALETGGLSWADLNDLRSDIGERIGRARFTDGTSEGQLRGLYGALSEDMRATAASISPRALRAFERANNLNREVETRIQDGLARILGNSEGQITPEAAANRVRTIMGEGKHGANLGLLSDIRASTVKDGGWDQIVGTLVRHMGQPANSQGHSFDPQTFVQSYADMSEPARNLMFGSLRNGRGETNPLRKAMDDFVEVNQRLAGVNALRNTSQSVPNLVGAGIAGSAALSWIQPLTALKLAAGAVGANGLARVWTDPRFVRWATGYTKMVERALASGRSPTEDTVRGQRDYLLRVARSSPAIAAEIGEVADQVFPTLGGDRQPAQAQGVNTRQRLRAQ